MRKSRNRMLIYGFTLLELMIVLGILAIMVTIIAPNVRTILAKHRIISELNQLSSLMHLIRAHAIDEQTVVTLCPSADLATCQFSNWDAPKIAFLDHNNDKFRDQNEQLVAALPRVNKGVKTQGPKKAIQFLASGVVGSTATLTICPITITPVLNRALIISLQGRVRASKDYDQDGIHEVHQGVNVTCP